jgi:CRISPR-associated protein Csx17
LLDDLDPILGRLDGFLRAFPNIPATFESARRRIDEAMYEVCVNPTHEQFADLVRSLGRMEFLIAQRDRSKKPILNSPLHGLRPEWVAQCDDGQPEIRIAAALASIRSTGEVGPMRANMTGVDAARPWAWATGRGQQRWFGNSLQDRLSGVLAQRMMDADRLSADTVPIEAMLEISPQDAVPFLYGETDDQLLEELLWGFTLVNWWHKDGLQTLRRRWDDGLPTGPLPRGWCMLKLLHQPHRIRGVQLRREPRIQTLLLAGRAEEAVAVAYGRLRSQSLKPLPVGDEEWIEPQRQLAALLIPTSDQWMLERLVLEDNKDTNLNKEKF